MALINTTVDTNNGNDIQIVGTSAADTLDGGIKATSTAFFTEMFGGGGNDTYYIDAVSVATLDKVVELPNAGIDSVVLVNTWNGVGGYWNAAATSYTLSDNVENLSVLGAPINSLLPGFKQVDTTFQGMTIYGNALNNVITTGSGADSIYGGAGNDTMQGGAGADVYYVDAIGDKVIEGTDPYYLPAPTSPLDQRGNQTDTVFSIASFTLGSGLENLFLDTNAGNINGTGNAQNNVMYGSAGNNVLSGLAGNDFMYGGGGKDTLLGGDGDDYLAGDGNSIQTNYFSHLGAQTSIATTVFGGDVLDGGNGNDTLAGADGDKLLGGAGNDMLYGNALNAAAHSGAPTPNEKMTMDGGAGNDNFMNFGTKDVIIGGAGIDTVFIDFGAVAVNYTLGADVERGILMNAATTADTLTGNALGNYLQGNAGNDYLDGKAGDDVLDGGAGADTMLGGDGNDNYMVDNLADVVIETNTIVSTDTVFSYIASYTLGNNVENLVLEEGNYTGGAVGASLNGKGNALNNLIIGNSRGNLLEGGAGKDTLDGGNGTDTMIGGAGDDVYYADRAGDIVQELADYATTPVGGLPTTVAGGIDSVILVNDNTTAGAHFFNGTSFTMTRNLEKLDASAVTLAGGLTGVNFTINGNESNNTIIGSRLNDTINGGAGIDSMNGGAGNDTYIVAQADVVSETLASLAGGIDTIMYSASLPAGFTMGANIENLVIVGGSGKIIGNTLDNIITGNGADNVIEGGAGKDTLYGNAGNDTLSDSGGDNTIDGGEGNDTMKGGAGNDTYVVDSGDGIVPGGDTIIDAGGTKDTVLSNTFAYTLGTGIENLTLLANGLNGTGNGAANMITGNAENNKLDGAGGNDTIDGGLNKDVMIGGTGDDTFYVDNIGDIVREDSLAGGGLKDTVISTISYSLADTDGKGINDSLGGGVENLTLASTVTGGAAAFNATGNAFNNIIIGNENNNIIDGGSTTVVGGNGGADTMTGGDGNDTYMVDNTGDKITELTSVVVPVTGPQVLATVGNADSIYVTLADASTFNMTTNALNVERLHILDNTDLTVGVLDTVNVTGNASDNIIWGGLGKNSIDGGDGNDIITGGAGNDTLVGGKGDDVLNGDGLFQNAFNGAWINASGGLDSMNGGDGSDTYYVDVGDGAGTLTVGAAEDVVADSGVASLTAKDTVKLVGTTINNYTLDTAIENLDLSGLTTTVSVTATGNVSANAITGMERTGYTEVLSGGDGNDNFVLTPTNGANDTIRGGSDTVFGGATTADTSKADTIYAKVDTTVGAVVANIDMKQIEAVTLDVSNMVTTANAFTWNFTSFGDASNFTQAPSATIGNVAPTFTISGGVTLPPDTTASTVTGNITISGLDIAKNVTYVLANYGQNALTTTLDFGTTTAGTTDKLNVVLDNHKSGGLAATGIETLNLVSIGDVMSAGNFNVLDVSAVTKTAGGMADIDVTGDSSLQLRGLATNSNINLHDYAAQNFNMLASAAASVINLALNNVETQLVSNGTLTTLNLAVTNSAIGNIGSVINASGLNNATATLAVSGAGNLTLNNLRGGALNMTGTGQLDLNAVGGAALNLTASNGVVIANVAGVQNDTYTFGTSLNNLDSITDAGGGADTLSANITALDAATGQLHIAGVETLDLSAAGNALVDGQFITGANTINLTGSGNVTLTHMTLGQPAAVQGLLNASTFTGNLFADFSAMTGNGVEIREGINGNDTLVGSAFGGGDVFVMYGGGIDFVSAGAGDDVIDFAEFGAAVPADNTNLTSADTVDGGAGFDVLNYYGGTLVGPNAFDNVANIEKIVFGAAATTINALDTLVAAGASLLVDASNLGAAQIFIWNGALETDGAFEVLGGDGADVITGGAGNDIIEGGLGLDVVNSGAGDDLVNMLISAADIDAIDAGIGNDTLRVTGTPAGAVVIDLSSVTDQIVSINAVADTAIQIGFENFDAANMGGTAALTITAAATGSTIVGGGGADTINGGIGNDTLTGNNGVDNLTGGAGNDTLTGGNGVDIVNGGDGNDTIFMFATTGNTDTIDAGADNDTLVLTNQPGGGANVINLSSSIDQITLLAGAADAPIQLGFENLNASAFTTRAINVTAAATGSNIIGGGAADTIIGGAGVDVLTGNGGNDRFVFNTSPIAGNIDTITDFTVGNDKIDLAHTAFDMVTTALGGLNTSEFASGAGLITSSTAGTVLLYNTATGNLYYDADANGSGTGVLISHLQGLVALTAADINII